MVCANDDPKAHAQSVLVLKRGKGKGFSGAENELFVDPKTSMLLGDAGKAKFRETGQLWQTAQDHSMGYLERPTRETAARPCRASRTTRSWRNSRIDERLPLPPWAPQCLTTQVAVLSPKSLFSRYKGICPF